jgi:predicted glycosyltransferase
VLRAALETRPLTSLKHHTWRLLAGQNLPQDVFDSLRDAAPDGVIVERARADFVTLLKNCHLSVSQGGYNTIMEILLTRARAVAVPYAGGNESEQTLRTQLLAERGLLQVVREDELTPQRLAAAIERAISGPPPPAAALDMDGAAKSAGLVRKWIDIRG